MTNTRIVGLGSMGAGMARNLLKGGFALAVDDLDADRVAALVADGAVAAQLGPVEEDVVILSLPAPQHVSSVCLGDDGLIARMRPGATLVNASTVDLPTARNLGDVCAAAGVVAATVACAACCVAAAAAFTSGVPAAAACCAAACACCCAAAACCCAAAF